MNEARSGLTSAANAAGNLALSRDQILLFRRVGASGEFVADVMSATTRRSNHAIEGAENSRAVLFGCLRFFVAAAIGHGLAATCLIPGIYDVDSQSFEQFKGGDADTWIKRVNVTGNHESDLHCCFT